MKKSIFICMSVLFLFACGQKKDTIKLTIASQTVDCSGVGKQKCMLVKKGNAGEWEYFYSPIEGFNYEEGNEYVVEVEQKKVDNAPADASSIRYILVKQLSKTAKTSDNLPPAVTQTTNQYQWGGKILEIEHITTGRGAAAGKFPAIVVKIEVSHSATDLFNPGDIIYAELNEPLQVEPVVGREYVFKSNELHPAHAKGIYMLNTTIMDLVV